MIPAVVDWILLIYAAQGGDVGDDDLVIQEVILDSLRGVSLDIASVISSRI